MIKNYLIKCAVLLTFLQIVCGESSSCPSSYWPCKNGQCIRNDEVCDGAVHCADKSDETTEQCLLTPCPSYAFQCAYGACITGNFKCNGKAECADGSDETRFQCNNDLNFVTEIQGTCKSPSTMQCKSGECVSSSKVCDGSKDCQDGSDETVELCSYGICPHYSFRCGYGACVPGLAKCNHIADCMDGSDELPNVCVLGYRPSVNYTQTSNTTTTLFAIPTPTYTAITVHSTTVLQNVSSAAPKDEEHNFGCLSNIDGYEIDNNYLSNSTNNCPLYYSACYNNSQCIRNEKLCDGATHCTDKSDETVERCLRTACPSYAFQCTYGACITGTFKCNGIEDCADGSDENRYLCNTDLDFMEEIQGNCNSPSSMECKSGECIDSDQVCDGLKHCSDGSDETVELCSSLDCPPYAFRCGYGACIPASAKCNGKNDCMDGSDEMFSTCGKLCETVPPSTSNRQKPVITTDDTPNPPVAIKYCSSRALNGISTNVECFHNDIPVSCYLNLRPGTIANVTCASGYMEKRQRMKPNILMCDQNGEWNNKKMNCTPECGILREDQKNTPIKPWDVSIFKRNYIGLYSPACSGVIVSPKVVLTAAKCMMNHDDGGYVEDHVFYHVIQGFYNTSYNQGDHLSVSVYNISRISIKSSKRAEDLAVLILVNYFQFSYNLKPICLPNIDNNQQLLPDNVLNIGRPYMRNNTRIRLEYLTACVGCERKQRLANYVNIYQFLPFINREIRSYMYIL